MANRQCPGNGRAAFRFARYRMILAAGLAACCSLTAIAAEADKSYGGDSWAHFIDVTNPYLSLEYTNDSNVLRLDDIQPATNGRADQYATLAAGFDSDIRVGPQRYVLRGEFSPTRYRSHDELNYNGGRADAVWHWTVNDALTGTAGYRYSRSLRNFANQFAPKRIVDIRTENRIFASADKALPDNWKLGVRGDFGDIAFSATDTLNLHRATGGASLGYVSRAGNVLGVDLEYIDGNYINNPSANFSEYTVGPTLDWKFTVRTQLNATIGYTARSYSSRARPDYSNFTGRAALSIADAGRGSLTATLWRKLSNLGDEIAEYAIVDGVSIEPAWTLSNGLTVRLRGSYEHRDFKVVTGEAADRLDDVGTVSGYLDWLLGRHFKITAGVTTERRSSTRLYQDYEFLQQQIQLVGTL